MSVESAQDRSTVVLKSGASTQLGPRAPQAVEPELEPGAPLGRYVVVDQAGIGGMGVVLRAYDPKLRREVALKRVRVTDTSDASGGISRLLREARAMAKLSHPNVVPVYDVEEVEDGAHVVMEYVEGRTLLDWMRAGPRRWPEVLELFVQAARGLAAAHEVGLVHRDFKPANVIVGTDGRARVLDFGLARAVLDAEPGVAGPASVSGESTDDAEAPVTAADVVIGTPVYMAPEQHRGAAPDARADQYAWCVALFEALAGRRPFVGKGKALLATKLDGPPALPRSVPRWLARVVARGLAPEPDHRFTTMHELLDAIHRARSRVWRVRAIASVAAVAVVAGAIVGGRELAARQRVAACEEAGSAIAEVWNPEMRARLSETLAATRTNSAAAERVTPWLDAYALSWQEARTQACLHAEVEHTWDVDMLARSLWCLDERRTRFASAVEALGAADEQVAVNAVYMAAGLAGVETCGDEDLLARLPTPPEDRRTELEALHAELLRAEELENSGEHEEGLVVIRKVIADAEALDWPPLVADARVREAYLLDRSGDHQSSARAGEEAYFFAARVGANAAMASAAEMLAVTHGTALGRPDAGLVWARHAELALEALGDAEGARAATHWQNVGIIHHARGAYDDARAAFERALEMRQAIFGTNHPDVAAALSNLAVMHAISGDYEASRASFERVLAIHEATLGPDHPDIATALSNLATNHYETEEYERALQLHERALAIATNALGPDHPHVARILAGIANVHAADGRPAEAVVLHERTLAILAKHGGAYPEEVARNLGELARIEQSLGHPDRARELYERSIETFESSYGPDHPMLAVTLVDAGDFESEQRHPTAAIALLERAVEVFGKADDALTPALKASAEFSLARALWDGGRDRKRAVTLARAARPVLASKPTHAAEAELVTQWLAGKE